MEVDKLKGRVKKHHQVFSAVAKAESTIKALPKYELLKLSTDITRIVGNIVENKVPASCNVDKKALAIQILTDIFNLTETEKLTISEQIDYLISVGKIKKKTLCRRLRNYLLKLVSSVFLPDKKKSA